MYLAFDTETSGLHQDSQVLTAFFIVLDSEFNEIDSLDLKIKYPVYSIQLKAFEINNIDLNKHEKESISFFDAKIKLNTFLLKNLKITKKNKFIPLGHNVKFDIGKINKFGISDHLNNVFNIDTLQIAKFFKACGKLQDIQSLSLKNVTEYFNIQPKGQLHTAECDIRLTIDLLKHFKTMINVTDNPRVQNVSAQTTTENENSQEILQVVDILLNIKKRKEQYEPNDRILRKRKIIKYY